jgi:hypothetical protein
MAILRVTASCEARDHLLSAACLVGRAPGCLVRVADPTVPSFWLELRWSEGAWRWRALAGGARTRGVGMLAEDGWRTLPLSPKGRPQRVRLDDLVAVELVEAGPPQPFAEDLLTGAAHVGDALCEVLEVRADGTTRPFTADEADAPPLRDGDVFLHEGRPWRLHLAEGLPPTRQIRIDLSRADVTLDIDLEALRATFHQRGAEVTIAGEHVRTLAAYASARRRRGETGGWLTCEEAYARWRALGGNPQSPMDRLGWDRGRCRSHLAREGVAGVEVLFEARRRAGVSEIRVGVG